MPWIAFVRHGKTPWNSQRLLQGHIDVELEDETVEQLRSVKLHQNFQDARWISSPLIRTMETAKILSGQNPEIEDRLIEMSWGEYEGLPLDALKSRIKSDQLQPARGLDLKPPGGESPRMVKARIKDWLRDFNSTQQQNVVAVTHKGVIRSVISLATDWDMQAPFEVEVDWSLPQIFYTEQNKGLRVYALNHDWSSPVACPL